MSDFGSLDSSRIVYDHLCLCGISCICALHGWLHLLHLGLLSNVELGASADSDFVFLWDFGVCRVCWACVVLMFVLSMMLVFWKVTWADYIAWSDRWCLSLFEFEIDHLESWIVCSGSHIQVHSRLRRFHSEDVVREPNWDLPSSGWLLELMLEACRNSSCQAWGVNAYVLSLSLFRLLLLAAQWLKLKNLNDFCLYLANSWTTPC